MKKKVLAILLTSAMVVSLAACGSSTSSTTAATDATTAAGETTSAAAGETTAAGESTGERIDSLAVGISTTKETLVPFQGASEFSAMIYEPLGDRTEFSGEFQGILMESYEQIDDTTYQVTIYDDIYDSEGNHITADDVAFSWNECQRIGELSETGTVESVTKVSDYVVEFKWGDTPAYGDFEAQMSNVNIVSQAAYEASGDGMATMPVGTGPYKVTDYTQGISITLEARDDYWAADMDNLMNRQKSPVQTVRFDTISESTQIANALKTGSIDISADVSVSDVASLESNFTVDMVEGVQGYVLYPNCSENSPLHDENLRKAVFSAINKSFITAAIQGGYCDELYAMGSPKYSDYQDSWSELAIKYDLDKAKEYLAQSEYPDGVTLKLITPTMGYNPDIAEIIQGQLAEIGITLEIDVEEFGNYFANEGNSEAWDFTIAFLSSNDYITNCWAKYWDTDNTGIENDGKPATKNFLVDSELQELIDTCTTEEGHTDANTTEFWSYVMDHAYCCPLVIPQQAVVYNSKIASVAFSGSDKLLVSGFTFN